jgi:hypothetical protein
MGHCVYLPRGTQRRKGGPEGGGTGLCCLRPEKALGDPVLSNFYVDMPWDEMAKYLVGTPELSSARPR